MMFSASAESKQVSTDQSWVGFILWIDERLKQLANMLEKFVPLDVSNVGMAERLEQPANMPEKSVPLDVSNVGIDERLKQLANM